MMDTMTYQKIVNLSVYHVSHAYVLTWGPAIVGRIGFTANAAGQAQDKGNDSKGTNHTPNHNPKPVNVQ